MNNSNMMCDLKTGVCGPGDEEQMEMIDFNLQSPKSHFTMQQIRSVPTVGRLSRYSIVLFCSMVNILM